jgi:uncharacterized membrane protein YbhN (UPF0104 family)
LLVGLGVLAGHPDWLVRLVRRLERWLPAAAGRLAPVIRRFTEGLAIVRQPRRLLSAVVLSVPLWLGLAAPIWMTALAFDMAVPFTGSFLIVAFLVIGVAVPTPGAIGGYHAAFQVAVTTFYGVSADRAVGGAIVLHAITFLPVVAIGAVLMVREGLSFARMRALATAAAGDEEAGRGDATGPGTPGRDAPAVEEPEGVR